MKTPSQFVQRYIGKSVDYDGKYGVQCVDAFKIFCTWAGIPVKATPNNLADGYWYSRYALGFTQYFYFIEGSQNYRNGDWVIWAEGSSSHPASHIAMYFDGKEFGENQSASREFILKNTNFNDSLGALRWANWKSDEGGDDSVINKTLNGIDISNHQGTAGFDISKVAFDFAIMKSTEGIGFVDKYCDKWVQFCRSNGKLWGFYHFARPTNDPVREADFWYENTKNYFGEGLPVLDVEIHSGNIVDWCVKFLTRIIELSGVKPVVYMSEQSFNWAYDWTPVVNLDCGLWIAAYRSKKWIYNYDVKNAGSVPQQKWWPYYCMWQYTSTGHLNGYDGNLDCNIFYGNKEIWEKYCGIKESDDKPIKPEPTIPEPEEPTDEESKKINWKQKLSSRKFWALMAGLIITTLKMFGIIPDESMVNAELLALGSIVAYILGESWVDANRESGGSNK